MSNDTRNSIDELTLELCVEVYRIYLLHITFVFFVTKMTHKIGFLFILAFHSAQLPTSFNPPLISDNEISRL